MRIPLVELAPEWLSSGVDKGRQGVSFACPEHGGNCRIEVWFERPLDDSPPVTETDGRPLYQREGWAFEGLTVYPPIEHGEALVLVYEGLVNVA